MIKFFRRIRQRLLSENKFIKYFFYAIGEILLVVIGILIALQINNWNEGQNLSIKELALLEEINDNLASSKYEIEWAVAVNRISIRRHNELIDHINKDLPYSNNLDTVFGIISNWPTPRLFFSGYESLKTEGIDIIKNQRIKDWINYVYESAFQVLIDDYDRYEWERGKQVTFSFVEKYIRRDLESNLAKPNDFEKLKRNNEFINLLHSNVWMRKHGIGEYEQVMSDIDSLSNLIESEIKLRRK